MSTLPSDGAPLCFRSVSAVGHKHGTHYVLQQNDLVSSLLYPVIFTVPTTQSSLKINNISPCLIFTVIDKPEIGLAFQL